MTLKDGVIKLVDENHNKLERELLKGEAPINKEKAKETFIKQFLKTGESEFIVQNIKVDENVDFYPVSQLNEIRRNLLEELMEIRLASYRQKLQKEFLVLFVLISHQERLVEKAPVGPRTLSCRHRRHLLRQEPLNGGHLLLFGLIE